MSRSNNHEAVVEWTGNRGTGTSAYRAYDRTWNLATPGKPVIACSNDPALGGDRSKHNPEDLLVAALSSCHMLWYLHLCADAGITVIAYRDDASGEMAMHRDGSGEFTRVTLLPKVTVTQGSDAEKAHALHGEVHKFCFIARSVNFPVNVEPQITVAAP
ncbi:MAG TPA: OsmC family protein [Rhizobiaceae bacterium]|nr:OsmC family protein [Rhizobiaceae bacterium]